jgi:hypothetical protein
MAATDDVRIRLNQNLWGLVLGLGGVGAGEYFHLVWLFRLSFVVAIGMFVSMAFSTFFYTRHYCKKKREDWKQLDQKSSH